MANAQKKKKRFGFFVAENKLGILRLHEFATFAKTYDVEFVKIDPTLDIEQQGHFDLILQKMTHLLVKQDQPKAKIQLDNMRNYLSKHPECVVVDPLDNQAKTIDRLLMNQVFNHLNNQPKEYKIRCPQSVVVDVDSKDPKSLFPPSFKFPAICKTLQASGGLEAHEMAIVWNLQGLEQFKRPIYVQEYINHNATIIKVYVLGENSHVIGRKSFPNFSSESHAPIIFNSQEMKHQLPPELTVSNAGEGELPPKSHVNKISKLLSDFLGLTLFGYDIITDAKTGEYGVIDINYFPDYRGVDNFFEQLLELLISLVNKGNKPQPE